MKPSGASAWAGLAVVYLGFLTVGFVFHFIPPVLPAMLADLGISHGQAGLLMSLFALPGILLSLPGGWLADRMGPAPLGAFGLLAMGLGTLAMGLAPGFTTILAARAIAGIGWAVAVVALQRLVVKLFVGRPLGLPMGIGGTAVPLGIIIILNVAGPWGAEHGWRSVAKGTGLVTAAAAILVGMAGTALAGRSHAPEASFSGNIHRTSREGFGVLWAAAGVWFCANGSMTGFMTFAPDHFFELDWSIRDRGLVTSIPMWISVLLGPVTGWMTDRHGRRAGFITAGMGLMAVSLALVPSGVVPQWVLGVALGVALAAVVSPLLALPGLLLPPGRVGWGFGVLATFANLGIFCIPPLVGLARDRSGAFVAPFLLMGIVALAGVLAWPGLRRGRV